MEKLFVGYEEALALREIGFDEPCFDSCKRLYSDGTYSTYEEAELECLKKLIEIVKNKLYD